jgi:hypothetical protein
MVLLYLEQSCLVLREGADSVHIPLAWVKEYAVYIIELVNSDHQLALPVDGYEINVDPVIGEIWFHDIENGVSVGGRATSVELADLAACARLMM